MTPKPSPRARWSQQVTENSRALALDAGVFTWDDPRRIARSLQRSAEASTARKSTPFQSAMSMLVFYINRAGKQLSAPQRARLEAAKDELRALYGKPRRGARNASPPIRSRTKEDGHAGKEDLAARQARQAAREVVVDPSRRVRPRGNASRSRG